MRLLALVLTTLVLAAFAPALAAAHHDHDPCGTSKTLVDGRTVHVDLWTRSCIGAVVSFPIILCHGFDFHFGGVHVLYAWDGGCQTGVLVETTRGEPAGRGVLP